MIKQKELDYSLLNKIGLSKAEVGGYKYLHKLGVSNMAELVARTRANKYSLYRVMRRLEEMGFVEIIRVEEYVNYFAAKPLDVAIEHFFRYQLEQVRDLLSPAAFLALQPIQLPARGLAGRRVVIC